MKEKVKNKTVSVDTKSIFNFKLLPLNWSFKGIYISESKVNMVTSFYLYC